MKMVITMLDSYKRLLQSKKGNCIGEALNSQSIKIVDATFKNDPAYRKCRIHDELVDAKYFTNTKYSINKDHVDYHVQFRPGVHYPIGTYIDIPNDIGEYNTWLIVGENEDPQFIKYNVLKCNWTFKWIYKRVIHSCLGVLRNRNSYNSGVWTDYMVTSIENQIAFWLPTNEITNTIDYDQRFLITMNKDKPVAWSVTKREDVVPIGITKFTLKQDKYNPVEDNPDLMIANYYTTTVPPSEDDIGSIHKSISISYKGINPNIKCGGSPKVFSVTFYGIDNEILEDEIATWEVLISKDYEKYLFIDIKGNQLTLQCDNVYSIIGQPITLCAYNSDKTCQDTLALEVVSL